MSGAIRYILWNDVISGINSASTAVVRDKLGGRKEGELLEDVSFLTKALGMLLMEN